MPHQCTDCGHTFADGSKEMLSGCPDCGGNTFQFKPTADARETNRERSSPETPSTPDSPTETESAPNDASTPTEDRAQTDARRDTVSHDELAAESEPPDSHLDAEPGPETETGGESEPPADSEADSDMAALRRELNDQFESIKIIEPGQYELNLMELYNREEYIIALQEDGQYVIEVPETWLGGDG